LPTARGVARRMSDGKTLEVKVEVGREEFTPQHPYPEIWYDEDGQPDDGGSYEECEICGCDLSEEVCEDCLTAEPK
jgi:hypothetical protein